MEPTKGPSLPQTPSPSLGQVCDSGRQTLVPARCGSVPLRRRVESSTLGLLVRGWSYRFAKDPGYGGGRGRPVLCGPISKAALRPQPLAGQSSQDGTYVTGLHGDSENGILCMVPSWPLLTICAPVRGVAAGPGHLGWPVHCPVARQQSPLLSVATQSPGLRSTVHWPHGAVNCPFPGT